MTFQDPRTAPRRTPGAEARLARPIPAPDGAEPVRLLVVCPVYGYPAFLPEMLDSLLANRDAPAHRIVLADDGCDLPETYEICHEAQIACPERITYRRAAANGGLAAVRNAAVRHGLARWPDIECIIFLDADDRVTTRFLARSHAAFRAARAQAEARGARLGWVFEDPIFFGGAGEMVRLRADSPLWGRVGATHTSSSILSADIFRDGLFYEESMKAGSEDWEFWIRARAAGFCGVFCPDLGFSYRRRPGSMSAGVARRMEGNRSLIRLRNKPAYRADSIARAFAAEAPPALFIDEFGTVQPVADPEAPVPAPASLPDLAAPLAEAHGVAATPLPPALLFAERATVDMVRRTGRTAALLEFIAAHRGDAPVLKHVFRAPRPGDAQPGQSGVGRFGAVNGDWPQVLSVTDRALLARIAQRGAAGRILEGMKQVNWTWQADREALRKEGARAVFDAQCAQLEAEVRRRCPQSRRARWRPQGLFHAEVPAYLSGVKGFLPQHIPAGSTLVVFDSARVAPQDADAPGKRASDRDGPAEPATHAAMLARLIARETDRGQAVYALAGPHTAVPWLERACAGVLQIPMTGTEETPRAQDPERLLAFALNFSRVIALDVFALNDGARVLKQNGIACEIALSGAVPDHVAHGGLVAAFKAYSGVVLGPDPDLAALVEASGIAREKLQIMADADTPDPARRLQTTPQNQPGERP
jgi:GT2 family glycosyltransferase